MKGVDWEEQWKLFAKNFKDGLVQFPLPNGKTLLMKPGPGFGDLSHPTTNLVLTLMEQYIKGKSILDIGSGSGVLSIAAALFSAKDVTGIEIDPEAILHAKENATLNHVKITFSLPNDFSKRPSFEGVILMNMIMSEQKQAIKVLLKTNIKGYFITSGVLKEQKQEYLDFIKQEFGFHLLKVKEKDGWLGFCFEA